MLDFEGDFLLECHQAAEPLLLYILRNQVGKIVGGESALLLAVGECAHALETLLPDKLHQLFKVGLFLSGEANHQSGADMYARHTATDFSQKPASLVGGYVAAHVGQHAVGYVLQGDVEIFADIIPAGHHVEYIHREIGGVGVMQPYALHTGDVGQAVDELRQAVSAIKVKPIA